MWAMNMVDCVWNVMAHAQKKDFVFQRNGRVHLNRQGRQFSRLLAAEVCASAVVMLATPCSEVVWRVLGTHSIRQFPLHFPSRASPCAITFQLGSNNPTVTLPFPDLTTTISYCSDHEFFTCLSYPKTESPWSSLTLCTPKHFLRFRKSAKKLILSSPCLSVCLYGKTRLPLDGFSWNLVFMATAR
jgi:hypothetical protein